MDSNLAKKGFIEAYAQTFGNITNSCKAVGICRQTFYNWKLNDPDFVAELNAIEPEEQLMDLVEDKLVKKINEGDITALIFVAKTKGKKRGYIERTEVANKVQITDQPTWFDDGSDNKAETA